MLEKIVHGLAKHFEITVYSQSQPNSDYHADSFQIRSAPKKVRSSWLRWLFICRQIIKDHRKNRFDIVFAFWGYPAGLFAVLLGKIINCPSVIYLQGGDAAAVPRIGYGTFHKRTSRILATWAYERVTLLLAMSRYQLDALRSYNIKKEIHVIPWGLDLDKFLFRSKQPTGELKVIHVGHFSPVKDQATLIRAFSEISRKIPARLRLYGADAGSKSELEKLCVELNLPELVEFNDVAPYEEMPQHYAWADVMLHTSLSEGQCMALTEAAAVGVLMAGTNVAPLYDLGEKAGIIIQRGDYKRLSSQILELLEKPAEWHQKIHFARGWVEAHPLDWTITQIKNQLMKL
jgi:glycosyltransferase involved in cell wall biosynthesis